MKKYLIVGLGNIGQEYTNTRHNIGFEILDSFADKANISFSNARFGSISEYKFKGRSFIFLKPNTYMNLSGSAVTYWLKSEKIPLTNLLIISDDLNLPFAKLRLKPSGSNGGHNGLRDIESSLNTNEYNRLRVGISNEFKKGQQSNFVLSKFSDEELLKLTELKETINELIISFVMSGISITMNTYNLKN
ncbi:aminoacyl-tRNA hydrolase [Flavobacteriaceae bacterium]|nr:aminoacyl-tRNA hydrolase [Flavobacteriaceae bacterium]